jgi:hypothetical protein
MKYFRVALSIKDRRMKKFRGNEFVEIHTAG